MNTQQYTINASRPPPADRPPPTPPACSSTTALRLLPRKKKKTKRETHYKLQCFPYLYCALFLSLSFPLLRHALLNMFAIICTSLIAIQLLCVYIDKHIVYRFIRSAALFTLSFSFFFICCALLPCFPLRHTHTCKNTECVFSIQICLLQQNKCEKETNNNLQFMLK